MNNRDKPTKSFDSLEDKRYNDWLRYEVTKAFDNPAPRLTGDEVRERLKAHLKKREEERNKIVDKTK
jgi:hypothetical protein